MDFTAIYKCLQRQDQIIQKYSKVLVATRKVELFGQTLTATSNFCAQVQFKSVESIFKQIVCYLFPSHDLVGFFSVFQGLRWGKVTGTFLCR